VAERVGFEPTVEFPPLRFSRPIRTLGLTHISPELQGFQTNSGRQRTALLCNSWQFITPSSPQVRAFAAYVLPKGNDHCTVTANLRARAPPVSIKAD
jgi:hypothetical protein